MSAPKIISVHSFRGGSGKSNVTANLAYLLAHSARVAVVDTDIQSPGVHAIFNFTLPANQPSLNNFLWGECEISDAVYDLTSSTGIDPQAGSLFLIPASSTSHDIGRMLREGYAVSLITEGFQKLPEELQLDYLFIDTHPGVNEETLLSVSISDYLVLMMRPDRQDFQGTAVTIELASRLGVPDIVIGLNKVPPSMDSVALREHVEKTFGREVGCVLPLNFELAELGSSDFFVRRFPQHSWSREISLLAESIRAKS